MGFISSPASGVATLVGSTGYVSIPGVGDGSAGTLLTIPFAASQFPDGAYFDFKCRFGYVMNDAGSEPEIHVSVAGTAPNGEVIGTIGDFYFIFEASVQGIISSGNATLVTSLIPLGANQSGGGPTLWSLNGVAFDIADLIAYGSFELIYDVVGPGIAPNPINLYGSRLIIWN
jgi:hypothetical protein